MLMSLYFPNRFTNHRSNNNKRGHQSMSTVYALSKTEWRTVYINAHILLRNLTTQSKYSRNSHLDILPSCIFFIFMFYFFFYYICFIVFLFAPPCCFLVLLLLLLLLRLLPLLWWSWFEYFCRLILVLLALDSNNNVEDKARSKTRISNSKRRLVLCSSPSLAQQ